MEEPNILEPPAPAPGEAEPNIDAPNGFDAAGDANPNPVEAAGVTVDCVLPKPNPVDVVEVGCELEPKLNPVEEPPALKPPVTDGANETVFLASVAVDANENPPGVVAVFGAPKLKAIFLSRHQLL